MGNVGDIKDYERFLREEREGPFIVGWGVNVCFASFLCEKSDGGFVWVNCHSFEGEPKFQRVKVGLKGMSILIVLWAYGGYSEVISVSVNFGL